jgi:hypothetical protein
MYMQSNVNKETNKAKFIGPLAYWEMCIYKFFTLKLSNWLTNSMLQGLL